MSKYLWLSIYGGISLSWVMSFFSETFLFHRHFSNCIVGAAVVSAVVLLIALFLDLAFRLCKRRSGVTFVRTKISPELKRIVRAMHTIETDPDNRIEPARKFARDMAHIFRNVDFNKVDDTTKLTRDKIYSLDSDRVVTSEPCVIANVHTNSVDVEIKGVVINFPRILFEEDLHLYVGQPVSYTFRERVDGTQYQVFVA